MKRAVLVFFILITVIIFFGGWTGRVTGDADSIERHNTAYFAGGCFWCMEEAFEKIEGVVAVTSGYMGGEVVNPSYEEVSAGRTGHAESVKVVYDSAKITYRKLLEIFWKNVDPFSRNAQFCDLGDQYRSSIFFETDDEKRLAEVSKQGIEESRRWNAPIVTQIVRVSKFYLAEEYHQDFYKKNVIRYKFYKYNCGRTQRLEELWGKP